MVDTRFPKVQSRKQYMDYLQTLMWSYHQEYDDLEDEIDVTDNDIDFSYDERKRRPQLKSFIIESNSNLKSDEFKIKNNIICNLENTGLDDIKLLNFNYDNSYHQFFLDLSDKRFWKLHTNALANIAKKLIKDFIFDSDLELDTTWYPTNILKDISRNYGNINNGFRIDYTDFLLNDPLEFEVGELKFSISGRGSEKAHEALKGKKEFENSLAYTRVRIHRKQNTKRYVIDDMTNNGVFVVKNGSSIDDHMSLVDIAQDKYSEKINEIENFRLGISEKENKKTLEGKAFDLEFKRKIDDIELFLDRILSQRFRIWGLKSLIKENFYQISAVDLHTGDPFDMELSNYLMRIYLPKKSCGNVILRLIVNLQQYYDSNVKCEMLGIE